MISSFFSACCAVVRSVVSFIVSPFKSKPHDNVQSWRDYSARIPVYTPIIKYDGAPPQDLPKKVNLGPQIISKETKIPFVTLPLRHIPKVLEKLLNFSFKDGERAFSHLELEAINQLIRPCLCEGGSTKLSHNKVVLNEKNYIARFRYMMWIEEFDALEEFRVVKLQNLREMTSKTGKHRIVLKIESISNEHASLISKGDSVLITPTSDGKKTYEGHIESFNNDLLQIKINEGPHGESHLPWSPLYDLQSLGSRYAFKLCHKALDDLETNKIVSIMFPKEYGRNVKIVNLSPFFNKTIARNEEQIQAVKNIVENRAYPAPYVLFGPPGTGKTSTLVEAICQIWSIFKNSTICVCGSSNAAADVIACRLLKYISFEHITRVYALSREWSEIPKDLMYCSNFNPITREIFFPSICELRNKRIVIMTPATAGRFVTSNLNFDYLFIDEAGHMVEVDALIPIVGFLSAGVGTRRRCSLIISGDHLQLEPVVKSPAAKAMGYDMSLLERLMEQCNLYKKDPFTLRYNPNVITVLVNNYRSHEKILHIPNKLLYDGQLLAKGSSRKISCFCNWVELPVSNFPVIFHSVKGKELQERKSKSYFNNEEIDVLIKYIKKILNSSIQIVEKDIGIISPYRKQVEKISERLSELWPKITIASVEEFQGQERKVIIISTVRSCQRSYATQYKHSLGFLKDKKRFNVAITRAEALLIAVGNPDVLQCDPSWRVFIEYCARNRSFVGAPARGSVPSNFNPYADAVVELKGF